MKAIQEELGDKAKRESDIEELISEGYDTESINEHYKAYLMDIVREYSLMSELRGNSNIVDCNDLHYEEHEDGLGWDIYIRMELLTPMIKGLDKVLLNLQIVEEAYSNSTLSKSKYAEYFSLASAHAQATGRRFYGEVDPNYNY